MQYAKSTYRQLIDAILSDVRWHPDVSKLSPEAFIYWILQAEEYICQRIDVKEEYVLRYLADISDYYYQDRPPVTAATNATPSVITATAHGLVLNDIFWITGIRGMTTAEGRMRAKAVATNTITLEHYRRVKDATNATPIVILLEETHPFVTGNSVVIAGVTGNTAANGTWTITKVNDWKFSLDTSVGNADYGGGGTAVKDVAADAAYISGGRFWKENEIPTYFRDFDYGTLLFGNTLKEVDEVTLEELEQRRARYEYSFPYLYSYPIKMAPGRRNGIKYQTFEPTPLEDNNLTMYGKLNVNPDDYSGDPEGTNIHLSNQYNNMILAFVKAKVASATMKDGKMALKYETDVETLIGHDNSRKEPSLIRVVYH